MIKSECYIQNLIVVTSKYAITFISFTRVSSIFVNREYDCISIVYYILVSAVIICIFFILFLFMVCGSKWKATIQVVTMLGSLSWTSLRRMLQPKLTPILQSPISMAQWSECELKPSRFIPVPSQNFPTGLFQYGCVLSIFQFEGYSALLLLGLFLLHRFLHHRSTNQSRFLMSLWNVSIYR